MIDPALARAAREAPLLAVEAERALLVRAKGGDRAACDEIVRSHLRLVIAAAVKRRGYKVPTEDLIQDGTIGLMEAIAHFDPEQPVRFATYAMWWVRAAMNDAAMRGQSIVRGSKSPAAKALFFNLRRARADLERSGRLSDGEIIDRLAARFGVDAPTIRAALAHLVQGDSSLNAPIGESEFERQDTLADEGPLPDETAVAAIDGPALAGTISTAMACLTERERAIITARRLVEDGEEQTLEQIGARFGVTRERVRQLEVRALEKMRKALLAAGVGPEALAA